MEYDVFIMHASEDKSEVAAPLAQALIDQGLRVWFDEFELKLGDSLRRNIGRGLSETRFGVVILGPHFLRQQWPQIELDALLVRDIGEKKAIILPVWHNLSI